MGASSVPEALRHLVIAVTLATLSVSTINSCQRVVAPRRANSACACQAGNAAFAPCAASWCCSWNSCNSLALRPSASDKHKLGNFSSQREATVGLPTVHSKSELFNKLTTTNEADEEDQTAWSNDMEGHAEKCVEFSADSQRKMYLLFSSWQHHAQTITKYLQKIMKQSEGSLRYVLKLF